MNNKIDLKMKEVLGPGQFLFYRLWSLKLKSITNKIHWPAQLGYFCFFFPAAKLESVLQVFSSCSNRAENFKKNVQSKYIVNTINNGLITMYYLKWYTYMFVSDDEYEFQSMTRKTKPANKQENTQLTRCRRTNFREVNCRATSAQLTCS
jgi:hypothetical protein